MLIAFSVTPLGVGEAVGEIVAEAVRVVRASGLPCQTDSMFTTVEGDCGNLCTLGNGLDVGLDELPLAEEPSGEMMPPGLDLGHPVGRS